MCTYVWWQVLTRLVMVILQRIQISNLMLYTWNQYNVRDQLISLFEKDENQEESVSQLQDKATEWKCCCETHRD